tara:strand:- start:14144 stop:14299 length:156 start_codon:yes stop_codon:yes gene_type:complete
MFDDLIHLMRAIGDVFPVGPSGELGVVQGRYRVKWRGADEVKCESEEKCGS